MRIAVISIAALFAQLPGAEKIPAFPGAEGAGMYASGGRGGKVVRVTNLNAKGPGSFADAVSQGNRIVVFDVSGIIDLNGGSIKIAHPNITIAGQTAPGEGICIKGGSLAVFAGNVIIRHIRVRRGKVRSGDMGDGLNIKGEEIENIIADHVSASWATDENLTLTNARNVTAQYSISAEAMDYFNPNQTPPRHAFGSLFGSSTPGAFMTVHHTIYAHNRLRNARTTGGELGPPVLDFRNNVIYDAKELTSHTGSQPIHANWIGNYVKDGPSTGIEGHDVKGVLFTFMSEVEHKLFAAGNILDGYSDRTADNWKSVRYRSSASKLRENNVRATSPFATPQVTTHSAQAAYETDLDLAGAILPSRDLVDWRIVRDIRNGTGAVLNDETDLTPAARWPNYRSLPPPKDSDGDGIPDDWEDQFGLDKTNPADANADPDGDGYTNIEEYLNNTNPTGKTDPLVYVSAHVSRAWRGSGDSGVFRIWRSGGTTAALSVKTSRGGVTIPAGALFADLEVLPGADADITLRIESSLQYKTGLPRTALVVASDGAPPPPADVREIAADGAATDADKAAHAEILKKHKVKKDEKLELRKVKAKGRKP
ncbi:MAG: hypothetical protein HYZ37_12495 [Candidatus Solibacter usitatus]|nr:hypothetical protein [Candidatus Solibacter usitatus]